METKSLAQSLHEAYNNHTGWKSISTGADVPQWDDLPPEKKNAWQACGNIIYPTQHGSFGWAIEALKSGHRVARQGWNGKNMWLSYSPGSESLPAANFWSTANREYAESQGGSAKVLPCITMKTATGEILMGWLASQSDMLADDYYIVSEGL